jgi:hypothetical protein
MLYDEDSQLFWWMITKMRLDEGAYERFSFFKCQWFPHPDSDGHDRSCNYYDRVSMN